MHCRRVLIFSLAYYPSHVSGAEAAVREITDRIAPTDIEFELVTLRFDPAEPPTERIGNVLVHRVGVGGAYLSKILFIPCAALAARRLHRANPFGGMWALMTYMLLPVTLARMLGVRVPYAVTLQDGDPYEKVFGRWFIRPVRPLLDRGFRGATVVQAISAYLATWPRLRGAEVPVEVVHNGADPGDLVEDAASREEAARLRERYGVASTDVLIGNTARLVYQKGWEDTIIALTLLPPQVKLLVVGGGPDDGLYRDLAAKHTLTDRVIFVGHVDRQVVTVYRRMLDIFVMPSRSEGLGNAGLSAMASGIPMVATREGGLAEYVFDPHSTPDRAQTAWVVERDAPEQIAEQVRFIMAHPSEVRAVTERARAMVLGEYHWDGIASAMRRVVFERLFLTS